MIVHFFTDGGAHPSEKGGWEAAWAYVEEHDGAAFASNRGRFTGENPTSQRAELWAAYEALQAASPEATEIYVVSDSQYLVMGMTQWINRWVRNGWKTAQRRQVENKDIWLKLLRAVEGKNVTFAWVPRDSVDGNIQADSLVQEVLNG